MGIDKSVGAHISILQRMGGHRHRRASPWQVGGVLRRLGTRCDSAGQTAGKWGKRRVCCELQAHMRRFCLSRPVALSMLLAGIVATALTGCGALPANDARTV